ncbi:MAG: hypothetical protein J5590_05890 [Clostridia bacterium]|nr:hypothetical protein [Clostridia bacterium]
MKRKRLIASFLALALMLLSVPALADGAFFRFSSPYCVSYLKNGSFYDVDQGVAPDVYIRDYANFYNRDVIVDLIHNLK